ncbi:MAG: flippase-like domain-containing protein [Clostridia bacterium]|nr:flippase-like domain-containing protein [Clostridia bacterium]
MDKTKKYLRNFLLFAFLVWLTFYILLKDQDMGELFNIIKTVQLPFVFAGIVAMLINFLCESFNMRRNLRAMGENVTLPMCYKYTLIGFFYSSITPAATGGQPMQIYYMHRDGIKASSSTLCLVMNLWSFQIMTISMALISICFFHDYLDTALKIFFVVGVTLNSMALTLLIIGIFSKKLSTGLVKIAIRIMRKFKVKKLKEKERALAKSLLKYNGSAKYVRANRKLMIMQFVTAFVQESVYFSIPFFVCKAFGIEGYNIVQIIALQCIVYATVSGIPSPGAVGVSEGAFISIFSHVFGTSIINGAMLLNRGISFYLFVFVCAIVVIVNTFRAKKEEKIKMEESK